MTYRLLTELDKREICGWHYEGDYAIYDLPSYEELAAAHTGFCDPRRAQDYLGFFDGEALVGYIHLMDRGAQVFLGIGVKPEACGKGWGSRILEEACALAEARFPGKPLCLEVRAWNTRAIRCYQSRGFRPVGAPYEMTTPSGRGVFVRMERG